MLLFPLDFIQQVLALSHEVPVPHVSHHVAYGALDNTHAVSGPVHRYAPWSEGGESCGASTAIAYRSLFNHDHDNYLFELRYYVFFFVPLEQG